MLSQHWPASTLLADASIEMTAKEIDAIPAAAETLEPGTRVNVTFLAGEQTSDRLRAANAVREAGLTPVPHISARRLTSRHALDSFLAELAAVGAIESVFAVGGDPTEPLGPYPDALSLIRSGLLEKHGVRAVAISGYPEGHPDIPEATLRDALADKASAAREAGLELSIITQFGFDAAAVIHWIEGVRAGGITAPIRVGVPGPAGIKRLLGFARRFGIAASASKAASYGFSLTNLVGTAGPDRFVRSLASQLTPVHGDVHIHLYPFGDLAASSIWLHDARAETARRA